MAAASTYSPSWQKLPAGAWLTLAVLFGLAFFNANPFLSAYAVATEVLIFFLLWVPGHPPVFFLGLSLQWLQASGRILQANLEGLPLNEYAVSPKAEDAVWMSLHCLVIFTIVCGYLIRKTSFRRSSFLALLDKVDVKKAFIAYVIGLLIMPLLNTLKRGGAAQIIIGVQSFEWVLFLLFLLAALRQKKMIPLAIGAFLFEFTMSFGGYFSSFREVFFVTIIGLTTIWHKIDFRRVLIALPALAAVLAVFVFWQGIKEEYRKFARGEGQQQVVRVSRQEANRYLLEQLQTFSSEDFLLAADRMLDRVQYTELLQMSMEYVPEVLQHENGKLWQAAVEHIIFPRFLFPGKPILNDSEVMRRYTGYDWVVAETGVSISMGWIAEAYVDFGWDFFFLPALFMAILFGLIYRYFLSAKGDKLLLNVLAVIPILLNFQLIERSGNKILGGTIMPTIVYVVILIPLLYPRVLRFVLRKERKSEAVANGVSERI